MEDLVLAVDAGTSGCKAMLFDVQGSVVAQGSGSYEVQTPQPGWAELDPLAVFGAVVVAVGQALEGQDARRVGGVGVSAQLGLVALAENGEATSPVLTWMDKRATSQAEAITQALGAESIYTVTGRRVDPEWAACKILWLKEEAPQEYAKTHKFLTLKDAIVHWLTGRFVMDETQASYSMLFNVTQHQWEQRFFDELSLDPQKMPEVLPATAAAGELQKEPAKQLGLEAGTPVFTGASDGTIATVGAGLQRQGDAVNVVGTTDVLFVCTDRPAFDPKMRTLVNCYALADRWLQGGPMSTTGGCVQWFAERFVGAMPESTGKSVYQRLDEEAAALPAGSEQLLCLPSLVGERTPWWNPHARGVFFGLGVNHGPAHLHRAILEGSAFSARVVLDILQEQGVQVERLLIVGGGAKSDLWTQIRADICNLPVARPRVEEATGLGTALVVGSGVGLYPSLEEALDQVVDTGSTLEPNPAVREAYDELYEKFVKLHDTLF